MGLPHRLRITIFVLSSYLYVLGGVIFGVWGDERGVGGDKNTFRRERRGTKGGGKNNGVCMIIYPGFYEGGGS